MRRKDLEKKMQERYFESMHGKRGGGSGAASNSDSNSSDAASSSGSTSKPSTLTDDDDVMHAALLCFSLLQPVVSTSTCHPCLLITS